MNDEIIALCLMLTDTSDERQYSILADQLRSTLNLRIESPLDAAQRVAIANHLPYAQLVPNPVALSAIPNV